MGKGANLGDLKKEKNDVIAYYTWEEIKANKQWIVINQEVYDVSEFRHMHPGGERLIKNQLGEDSTDAFEAFHTNKEKTARYLKTLKVGKVFPESKLKNQFEPTKDEITNDFRILKEQAEKMGFFEKNVTFFILQLVQVIACDVLAWAILYYFGCSWTNYIIAVALLTTSQAQAGWLQHDLGHVSAFATNEMNHFMQHITLSTLKGASCDWWNYRHNRHHAKPNTVMKDPDIRFDWLFMLGKIIPREKGLKKQGFLPFHLQQYYFFFIVPPLVMPIVFLLDNFYYLIVTQDKKFKGKMGEVLWAMSFFVIWFSVFCPILGTSGATKLYFLVRFFESHWFIWITQMSHLPMSIDHDHELSWLRMQLNSTCNVEPSYFNNWFSGHLNYQIEHHLFPTMPRHNFYKVAPLVESLCKKHDIPYINKTLTGAIFDIYYSLKESGELWYEAYHM